MNKRELLEAIVDDDENDIDTKAEADKALKAVLNGIKAGLKKGRLKDKKGKMVQLIGFGTFRVKKRKARTGVNPQTGEKIKIKASKTVTFKPGKNLKEAVQ